MAHLISARSLAVAALVSCSLPLGSAHAQLGKLKKLGAEAVKDKLAGSDKKDSAVTSTTGTVKPGSVVSGTSAVSATKKGNYTITESRMSLVLASLQPMLVDAEKRAARAKVQADYVAKRKTSQECTEKASANFNPASMMTANPQRDARMETLQKQAEAVNARLSKAMSGGDKRAAAFLGDTNEVLTLQMAVVTVGANCVIPFAPASVIEDQLSAAQRQRSGAESVNASFEPNAEAKSAMTTVEFGMVRERIALFALQQEDPSLTVGSEGRFTPEEQALLSARASELKRYAPLFKSGALRWQTWADLKSW